MTNIQLRLYMESTWLTALEIPYDDLALFSRKPRKWLDYLGHALTGTDGILSLSEEKDDVCDLDLPVAPGESDYFHAIGDAAYIDPDVLTMASTHSSQLRDTDLLANIQACDGGYCIYTGISNPDAAHIIPRAKGNDYIRTLTTRRRDSKGEQVVIEDIEDLRNVLPLNAIIYKELKLGSIAFLKTPVRSLKSVDVSDDAPGAGADPDGYRLTLHAFTRHAATRKFCAHGVGARLSAPPADTELDNRPPEVILTALYAGAAIEFWGTKTLRTALRNATREYYYPGGVDGKDADSDDSDGETKRKKDARIQRQTRARTDRWERRAGNAADGLGLAMALSSHYAQRQVRHTTGEKVEEWLKGNEH
ncbi:hypothetical protein BOTBODRAFT_176379 [Botryobasidium botryosum FD-172 SS1]|uniref:HNH nuclease domain-containing protein n=1 Tax=Botryobasidium botryosum (strain FD-172 SS1) TaxID=930990 RepID=A0A067MLI7_BOTB1|nr:hypothetical protein BOTBODRAFT_176379 [Botryobasidium botryosum FD-172 SS1]